MSFFEKMMQLNQQAKASHQQLRESTYLEEETAHNQDYMSQGGQCRPRNITRNSSLRSSISLRNDEIEEESSCEDIFTEPSIQGVYKSAKPLLMNHLLPRKQQMMREMLARKRQFELKKMSLGSSKGVKLENKVREESQKFKKSEIASMKQQKMETSKVKQFKASSVRNMSESKSKPSQLNLGESIYSASMNTQLVASPIADNFNKEIMLKLLNIIEKDRLNSTSSQNTRYLDSSNKKKNQAPIIINNIMKTPADNVNMDLIEREMKIRMLENYREQRMSNKNEGSRTKNKVITPVSQQRYENCATNRSKVQPEMKVFSINVTQDDLDSEINKKDLKCSISKREHKSTKEAQSQIQKQEKSEQNVLKQSRKNREDYQSTKNNSQQNSRIYEGRQNINEGRKRSFKNYRQKRQINNDQNSSKKVENHKTQNEEHQLQKAIQFKAKQSVKAPVRLQIPLEDQTGTQGMTLAEAFKKRVGRLKSEQRKIDKSPVPRLEKSELETFPSQMTVKIIDKSQYFSQKEEFDINKRKSISITLENPPTQRSVAPKVIRKPTSLKKLPKQEKTTIKKMSEPSKELMDRLIYGERAKISKEEMYALTKKNYDNLPEVQAKRKQEQKRKIQQQRLEKAKQYQKAIRSGKSNVKN